MDSNTCRQLIVDDVYAKAVGNADLLTEVMGMQTELQRTFGFEYNPDITIAELMVYLNVHHHALQDEIREFFNSLGGVDTHGSAAWKNWKTAFAEAQQKKLSDLSEGELLELQFEVVDMFQFWFNMALAVGVDAERFYNLYQAKVRENYDRIKRGY
jgi:hypothetical protein